MLGADRQTDRQGSLGAALWSWFLVGSEGNVRQWSLLARGRFRPSGAVLRAWELHFGAGFLSVQKATLGSGPCLLGAASVLQCHGVLLFRNRPLGGRCDAVLRAWELHFGAGFLSVPKATLGSGACLLNADRQTDRQTDRHRDTETQTDRQTGRQADRQTGRQADRQTGRRADGQTGRQADRQTGRQADRQTDTRTGRQADRQTGKQANRGTGMPWCVAVSEPPAETSLWS